MSVIGKWLLTAGTGGFTRLAWIGGIAILIGLVVAGIELADRLHENTIEVAEEAGADGARADGYESTLDQLEKANAAGNEIRDNRGSARYDACLLDAAPGYERNCERYKPVKPLPDGAPASGAPGA